MYVCIIIIIIIIVVIIIYTKMCKSLTEWLLF